MIPENVHIYCMGTGWVDNEGREICKIGIAVNPRERWRTLFAGNPKLKLLFSSLMPRENTIKIERELHAYFLPQWLYKELFYLSQQDISYARSKIESIGGIIKDDYPDTFYYTMDLPYSLRVSDPRG